MSQCIIYRFSFYISLKYSILKMIGNSVRRIKRIRMVALCPFVLLYLPPRVVGLKHTSERQKSICEIY